jgi:hypothetical protein
MLIEPDLEVESRPGAGGRNRLRSSRRRREREVRAEVRVRVLHLMATAALTAPVAAVALRSRPSGLTGRTGVMGYAVAHGFSPVPYERTFAGVVLVTLFALAAYVALGLVPALRSGSRSLRTDLGPDTLSPAARVPSAGGVGLRVGIAAFPLALEAVQIGGATGSVALVCSTVVPVIVGAVAGLLVRRRVLSPERSSWVVIGGAAVALVGVSAVSAATWLSTPSGRHHVAWFPWWAAVAAVAVGGVAIWHRRARGDDLPAIAAGALAWVVGPVVIVLLVARLPGGLTAFDLFHDGENLVPATAMRAGRLPWRDFLSIHGVLQDVLWSLPGLRFIEDSHWGAVAGQMLWLLPAYWIAQYALALWLYARRRGVVVVMVAVFAFGGVLATPLGSGLLTTVQFRMLLQPLLLVALGRVIAHPSWGRAATLGGLATLDLVLVPESLLTVAPIAVVLLLVEFDRRWREGRFRWTGPVRTACCGTIGLAAFGVWVLATGSGPGLVRWVTTFAVDHTLSGAIPIDWRNGGGLRLELTLTVGAPLAMIAYAAIRRRVVGLLRDRDWVMLAAALGTLAYFPKFLARADIFHLDHVWPLGIPVFIYLVVDAVDLGDRILRRVRSVQSTVLGRRLVACMAVGVVLVPSVGPIADSLREGSGRLRPSVAHDAAIGRVGYGTGFPLSPHDLGRLRDALDAAGARSGGFFDFTNSPALFHYVLGLDFVPPMFNVSEAIPPEAQRELIDDVEAADPQVVAWSSSEPYVGLPTWDGVTNQVRHYLVASWILDRYVPYVKVGGYGLWVRRGARDGLPDPATLDPDPDSTQVTRHTPPCDWGDAPTFLDARPSARARRTATTISVHRLAAVSPGGSGDTKASVSVDQAKATRWVEIVGRATSPVNVVITSDPHDRRAAVTARILPGGPRGSYVLVGACSQWRDTDRPLSVSVSGDYELDAIRLLR